MRNQRIFSRGSISFKLAVSLTPTFVLTVLDSSDCICIWSSGLPAPEDPGVAPVSLHCCSQSPLLFLSCCSRSSGFLLLSAFYLTDLTCSFVHGLGLFLSLHVYFLKNLSSSLLSWLSGLLSLGLLLTEFTWKSLDATFLHYIITVYLAKIQQKVHMSMREKRSLIKVWGLCSVASVSSGQLQFAYPRGQQQRQMMAAEWVVLCG